MNLSEYAVGAIFSPVVAPGTTATPPGTGTGTATTGTAPSGVTSPPAFNLNTISRGVSTADYYLAVPTAVVRFLETDAHTKVIAKPQLRGAEGSKLTLRLGQQIPVVSTSYTPIPTGGAGVNPLSSYTYKDVGVNIEMTPRVSLDGDIILDLILDNSAVGPDKSVAGVTVPTFVQRTLTTRLRLRDGESTLLAGLIQENESNTVRGFPGAIHVPFLKQVFSGNEITSDQTEIIMLLTPHIVRTQELTESDLSPIYIGSQQNLGVGGPPPLIAAPEEAEPVPTPAPATGAAAPVAAGTFTGPGGVQVAALPGSTPVPGTVIVTPARPTPAVAPAAAPVAPPVAASPALPGPPRLKCRSRRQDSARHRSSSLRPPRSVWVAVRTRFRSQ